MRKAETVLGIIRHLRDRPLQQDRPSLKCGSKTLESRVRANVQARFGGGPSEKARRNSGTSLAVYPITSRSSGS